MYEKWFNNNSLIFEFLISQLILRKVNKSNPNLKLLLVFNYNPLILFLKIQNMFCCRSKKKGRHSIEAYKKIKAEDKKEFMLNAIGGSASSPDLMERINSNKRVSEHPEPTNQNQLQGLVKGSLEDYIKKKILKSDYDDLIKKYSNSNEMWMDPDFPPTSKSFGASNFQVVWKRAEEIIQKPTFVSDNFTPSDILQGKLGNCYFLSAIAGLAQKPYRIKKIFPNTQLNKNGIYMARILHKGVYQEVVVDDYFPCTPNGQLIGAQPAAGSEIWVMILEKCWAKVFGSYAAIDGGLPNEVLHCFSAAPTYNYRVTSDKQQLEILWQKMMIADKKEQIICCGTQMETKKTHLTQLGLVGGHAYTILGVYEESYRILKIRNPWGNMQWKGSASENDKNFWSKITVDEQLRLGYKTGDDGTFFMLYQDFQKYFIIVDICQSNDNANYFYIEDTFSLSKPQCFDLKTDGGDLTISITQTSKRELKARGQKNNVKYAQVIILLARNNGNNQFEYVQSRMEENSSDFYLSQPHLPAGKYVVCCYVEGNSDVTDATVSVYSQPNFYIIQSGIPQQDFLHRCFLSHARNNQSKQIISKNPLQWICLDILAENCGLGYSAFHLDPACTRKIGLQFDQSQYQNNSLELLPPFRGTSKFKLVCNPGQQLIVLCRLKPGVYESDFSLPAPKMYRLK